VAGFCTAACSEAGCSSNSSERPALVLFTAVFSISTFVIGPQISSGDDAPAPAAKGTAPAPPASDNAHEEHH